MNILCEIPTGYFVVALLWSGYQGFRGATEHRLNHHARARDKDGKWVEPRSPEWECWERWVVLYVHDFFFRFLCTIAGFLALYVTFLIAGDLNNLKNLSPQVAALVAFLFLIGVIGVGGQLHYAILFGKVPR
jgi:hypothetical protein